MSQLDFGSLPADMTERATFGFPQYFSTATPVLTGTSNTSVAARDPVTRTAFVATGTFDLLVPTRSVVTGFYAEGQFGPTLMQWSQLALTYAQVEPVLTQPGRFEAFFASLLAGDDAVNGGSAGDVLDGMGGNDTISGREGDDRLLGAEGDDLLIGGNGDDLLEGGPGVDTVSYAGVGAEYRVAKTGADWQVTALAGPDGVDRVSTAEWLQFADQTLALIAPAAPAGAPAPAYGQRSDFLFDPVYYVLANPASGGGVTVENALQHYLGGGAAAGRAPNAWFDAAYYEARWSDLTPLALDEATLFAHFNLYGVWEGRSPGPKFERFDGVRYLTDNPDVAAYVDAFIGDFLGSRTNGAIAHFIIYGAGEQRAAFDTAGQAIDLGYVA